jgi:type IX secretion system PorP/SprF family membrane protein
MLNRLVCALWLGLLICFGFGRVEAQDPHFSQFFASPMYLNPAFVGGTLQGRLTLNYRAQWVQLPGEFVTYQVSYDHSVPKSPHSFGLSAQIDKAGAAGAKATTAQIAYAYKLKLTEKVGFKAGLQLGYGNRTLDYFTLVFSDQLSQTGYTGSPSAEAGLPNATINYIEAGAGLVLYADDFWLGVSGFHLNQPNHSISEIPEKLPMKISAQIGYKIKYYKPTKNKREGYFAAISPGLYYSQQGQFRQLDVGANGFLDPLIVGLWYRGVPIQASYKGALVTMVGFKYQDFKFLYSYDAGVGKFGRVAGGAHEFSLAIRVGDRETRKKYSRKRNEPEFPSLID